MNFESIQEMFGRAAGEFGSRVAIERSDRTCTYQELEDRANALANHLLSAGAAKGTVVAIISEDAFETITAIIGILRAGCVFAPLSPVIPAARLRTMIEEIGPSWFITESRHSSLLKTIATASSRAIYLDQPCATNHDTSRPALHYGPDDTCYLYFTSGSTDRPKAIAGRLKSIGHFIRWELKTLGLAEGPRVSQLTTPSFDAYLRDVFLPLCSGGTVCVPDATSSILETAQLVEWLDRKQINVLHCVPSLFRTILNADLKPDHFAHLKYVLLAGERLLSADVKRWMTVFGERIQLVNLYGPSETTMTKLFYFVRPEDQERRSIPIGKPISDCRAIVLDDEQRACPTGVVGEIYIRTPFRTLGYYNRPDLTSEVFIQNPFNADRSDIIYKTGDLGRELEDGNLEFVGRKDLQVKLNGIRLELPEIENVLRGYESVKDVVVADREDKNGSKYLCGYVVIDGALDVAEIKKFLAEQLPDYMIPAVFMKLDALPRTISGKIDRRALPAPAQTNGHSRPPATPIEEILTGIWREVLEREEIDAQANFFELGGHSLLVALLLSRVRRVFKVEIPLRLFFEAPTISGLAAVIENKLGSETGTPKPALAPLNHEGKATLSMAQQGLWFVNQLEPHSYAYNIPAAVHIRGTIDVAALERALTTVELRHDSLRTTFVIENGRPVQLIAPETGLRISVEDLRLRSDIGKQIAVEQICLEEPRRLFDLSRGPLLRVTLVTLSDAEHVLLVTMHHIISDAWSIDLLLHDLLEAYAAISADREPDLPKLPVQYADYAVWQRGYLEGEILETQLSYWKQQLSPHPQRLELPVDHEVAVEEADKGGLLNFALPEDSRKKVIELSRKQGSTVYMTLLAVYFVMLHSYSKQTDLTVGTPIANRNALEVEQLIGFFSNTLVLRADLSGEPSFSEILERVREVALAAYAHQDVPFNKVVESLKPKRGPNVPRLFQVSFNLLQTPATLIVDQAKQQGLELTPIPVDVGMIPFDLVLSFREAAAGLEGFFTYNSDLFSELTIAAMAARFQTILESVLANPETLLKDICSLVADDDVNFGSDGEPGKHRFQELSKVTRKSFDIPQPAV